MKKVYIAGPITGVEDFKANFQSAEDLLKDTGHEVIINPSFLPSGLGNNEDYMHICYAMIDKVDMVVILPGWEESVGTKSELKYAIEHNKEIRFLEEISDCVNCDKYFPDTQEVSCLGFQFRVPKKECGKDCYRYLKKEKRYE